MHRIIKVLKSPFSSGTNTPMSRSRANSIDMDSSYDMIGEEERILIMIERARMLEELLESAGFTDGNNERRERPKKVKKTVVMPRNNI